MTTKTIGAGDGGPNNGTYTSGYTLNMSSFSELSITNSGSVGGDGVYLSKAGTLANSGNVVADAAIGGDGAYLGLGGSVSNNGVIYGDFGVKTPGGGGQLTVTNLGDIEGTQEAVALLAGGRLTNGTGLETLAVVDGYDGVEVGAGGAVVNYGLIDGTGTGGAAYGVVFDTGGSLVNGSPASHAAVIEGYTGVKVNDATGTVSNQGTIEALGTIHIYQAGIYLTDGGSVTNGALDNHNARIEGKTGVFLDAPGTVTNYGTISGPTFDGVRFQTTGKVVNGAQTDPGALVEGYFGVVFGVPRSAPAGTVSNFGAIESSCGSYGAIDAGPGSLITNGSAGDRSAQLVGANGVYLSGAGIVFNYATITGQNGAGVFAAGGSVGNGDGGDATALIEGAAGVDLAGVGEVANYATITGQSTAGVLAAGGEVINGGGADATALIDGVGGVSESASASVGNYGTIDGATGAGVTLNAGGNVTNGLATRTAAFIDGVTGIDLTLAGTVTNYGAINGASRYGVLLGAGGEVTNGGGVDRSALIEGAAAIEAHGSATVNNSGTIRTTLAFRYGVYLGQGGRVTNGSLTNATALIEGGGGVQLVGGSVVNFGTILGLGDTAGSGFNTSGTAASLTNGSAGHTGALIEGFTGVAAGGGATVTNFGTIDGEGGTAVSFGAATDELIVEAGSAFIGAVNGGGGILELASGAGTIVLAGSVLTVSGSMAATVFSRFATVRIGPDASFEVSGNNTGALSVVGGTLTSDGTVSGTGHVNIDTGIADLGAGFEEAVDFTGTTGELKLGSSKTYTGKITGFSKTGATSLDLLDIAFAGTTTAVYTGTTTSGVLTVTEGANTAKITLEGNYLSSTFTVSAAPGGGTLVVDPAKGAAHVVSPPHQFIAAMARFDAPGASLGVARDFWRPPPPMLALPRSPMA